MTGKISASSVAKGAWVLVVVGAVTTYGWSRLRGVDEKVSRISAQDFVRASEGGQLLGGGPDTVVVFSNYGCKFCVDLFLAIDSVLAADHLALTVRVRHFAVPAADSAPFVAAVAAECAGEQGRFARLNLWLFRNHSRLRFLTPTEAASAAGISDVKAFQTCLRSRQARSLVLRDVLAGTRLGVHATPTIVTHRYRVTGILPVAQLLGLASGR